MHKNYITQNLIIISPNQKQNQAGLPALVPYQ